jgi:tripartite-type tricarboxylate transporter receptor subunit TctC
LAIHAQTWPSKPLRLVVGFPAGGGADAVARLLADAMSPGVGQQILVDNRPGASGTIAAEHVARSPADGQSFLLADQGTLVFATALFARLPFDPAKDLAPVGTVMRGNLFVVAGPASKAASLRELMDEARAQPGKINYASAGLSTVHHLAMELFKQRAGLDMPSVVYRGAGPAIQDVLGGQVPITMMDFAVAGSHVRAGKLRALAVTSRSRLPMQPDVPTIAEIVAPDFEVTLWLGMVAAAATPRPIVERINAELAKALASDPVRTRLGALGFEPYPTTPAQMGELLKADLAFWPDLIRKWGIKLE